MEECFTKLKQRWHSANNRRSKEYFGCVIDDPEDPLTNLRFADDVVLVASNKRDFSRMVAHLAEEAEQNWTQNSRWEDEDSYQCRRTASTALLASWGQHHSVTGR